MSFSFKVSISKTFHLKVFFFPLHFLSSSPYTTIPGTGDVLILLIGYPVYHSGKGRERGGEEARLCVRTLVISFSFLSLSSFSLSQ
jgi:hypothetical protein